VPAPEPAAAARVLLGLLAEERPAPLLYLVARALHRLAGDRPAAAAFVRDACVPASGEKSTHLSVACPRRMRDRLGFLEHPILCRMYQVMAFQALADEHVHCHDMCVRCASHCCTGAVAVYRIAL
jgi:hypothetical protein